MESAVSFRNGQLELRGIMHVPDRVRNTVGVILLCPGYKHRVGQHRLYVHIARRLCADGFRVLRFDFHGLGESEGEIKRCLFGDFWRFIQMGGFVEDTIAAVDFFENEVKTEKIVLMGLCGGAITAILAGADDHRVDGLIPINIPVMLLSGSDDWFIDRMSPELADRLLFGYLKRIASVESWMRLLSFKSDYRAIWKSIACKIAGKLNLPKRTGTKDREDGNRLSPYFLESFKKCSLSRMPILFIFSDNDKFRWAFEADFQERFLQDENVQNGTFSRFVVDKANHGFTLPEWREALLKRAIAWLHHHFGENTEESNGKM